MPAGLDLFSGGPVSLRDALTRTDGDWDWMDWRARVRLVTESGLLSPNAVRLLAIEIAGWVLDGSSNGSIRGDAGGYLPIAYRAAIAWRDGTKKDSELDTLRIMLDMAPGSTDSHHEKAMILARYCLGDAEDDTYWAWFGFIQSAGTGRGWPSKEGDEQEFERIARTLVRILDDEAQAANGTHK